MRIRRVIFVSVLALVGGCKKKTADGGGAGSGVPDPKGSSGAEMSGGMPSGSGSGSGSATAGSGSGSGSAAAPTDDRVVYKDGFSTPESVLYDADNDVYLVSNINGAPTAVDDNGYIAKMTPDGKVEKWLDGAKDDVKLDAPKGTGIMNGKLFVADITVVRVFDMKSGKQEADIKVPDAKFLNDIAVGKDAIFVSDTGVDEKFQPAGADAIYKIGKDGKVAPLIKNKDLGNPNGVAVNGDNVWVVTFGSGEVYAVDAKGAKQTASKPPKGKLDGIVAMDTGEVYVSSWEGSTVFKLSGKDSYSDAVTGVEAPADIGWDSKRKKLLIPLFQANQVVVVSVK